ncbi:MAG TPA: protein kinase [Candidatus Baltobacteraceae bacterium]|nr:protein kinase [Candidatus Baltobacteraceae bacterium]
MSEPNPHEATLGATTVRLTADDKSPGSTTNVGDQTVASSGPLPREELPGDVIGRYKLLEKIGEGGFGAVYVAEQREPVKRRVALKITKLGMDTKQVVARFEAERQALAMMDHPNIARALDAGTTDKGRPYFVMELVRGVKITEFCDQHKLTTRKRLHLFIKVCQAVEHAHQKGVIHRDIKPSNILVALHDGVPVPKVIDFGIAKATQGSLTDQTVYTQFNQFIGTPAYMSPEQAEMSGMDIDTRSDIYSLGVLLYELLTSHTPFESKNLLERGFDEMRRVIREIEPQLPSLRIGTQEGSEKISTASRHGTDAPKLVSMVRGDLDWVVMKCLEKDRSRRYDTASNLAADIQRFLDYEPVTARPPSNLYRFRKMVRRNRLAFAAASTIFVLLIVGLSVTISLVIKEKQLRVQAEISSKTAVAAREQADVARQQAVAAREQSELERKAAEAARQKTEAALQQSEADRRKAQVAEQKADDARKQAEAALQQSVADRTKAIMAEQKARDSQSQADTARQQTQSVLKRAETAESRVATEAAQKDDALKVAASITLLQQQADSARQRAEADAKTALTESSQLRETISNFLGRLDGLAPAEALNAAAVFFTPGDERQPWAARFLDERGNWRARLGDWTNAITDFSTVLDIDPEDPAPYHALAPLLLQGGGPEAYARHCARLLAHFAASTDPALRRQVAAECLLAPIEATNLATAAAFAGPGGDVVSGLAEYRQGHFAQSADVMSKALAQAGQDAARNVQEFAVLAMAQQQLAQTNDARATLVTGTQIFITKLPKLESGDIGPGWSQWLATRALVSEAQSLIGPTSGAR